MRNKFIFIISLLLTTNCYAVLNTLPGLDQGGFAIGGYFNRVIRYATTNTATCTADYLVLRNVNNKTIVVKSVSWTANISTASPPVKNGPDASSLDTSSAWRSLWCIYNPSSREIAGLISASTSLAPTALPSGFTFYERVGWLRNDSSSNFLETQKAGTRVTYLNGVINVGSAITSTSPTDVDASAFYPPGCRVGYINSYIRANGTSVSFVQANFYDKDLSTRCDVAYFQVASAATNIELMSDNTVTLDANRVFKAAVGTTNTSVQCRVLGYEDTN